MATTTIPWGDGSGDNIYLTYPSASGDQTVTVTSDANTGDERTKVVTLETVVGSVSQNLTVIQASGEIPGSRVTDYVQDGLILHMDGKRGKTAESWTSVVGDVVFTNVDAIMNSDNVEIDGEGYLRNTTFTAPASSNTIEVLCDMGRLGTHGQPIFMPKTTGTTCFLYSVDYKYIFRSSGSQTRSCPKPTTGKATFSFSNTAILQNGKTLSSGGTNWATRASSTYNYIGHGTSYCAVAKIYSIRIYNRQLTAEEAATNLAVDRLRFRGTEPYLTFDVASVGTAAAEHWGDGIGITASQAAAVYDFGNAFSGNTDIVDFDYMRNYFTGVGVIYAGSSSSALGAFGGCTNLETIYIPNTVTSIGAYSFYNCTSLTTPTIPSSVTSFGTYAFYGCTGLTSITIPSSVTSIGASCFYGCTGLTALTIPTSVTSIGSSAFYGCSSIDGNVVLSSSVTSTANDMFYNCTKIDCLAIYKTANTSMRHIQRCATDGVIYMAGSITTAGQSGQYSTCAHFITDGNFTCSGAYGSFRANAITIRIGGNYSTTSNSVGLVDGGSNSTAKIEFIEVMGTVSGKCLISTTNNRYCSSALYYHFGYNGVACTPTQAVASNSKIKKVYVGDGSSQAADQAVLDLYLADTNWATYSSKLDLWYNYSGDYKTRPTIPPDPSI